MKYSDPFKQAFAQYLDDHIAEKVPTTVFTAFHAGWEAGYKRRQSEEAMDKLTELSQEIGSYGCPVCGDPVLQCHHDEE